MKVHDRSVQGQAMDGDSEIVSRAKAEAVLKGSRRCFLTSCRSCRSESTCGLPARGLSSTVSVARKRSNSLYTVEMWTFNTFGTSWDDSPASIRGIAWWRISLERRGMATNAVRKAD